ncbi:MAG: hypothetical protein KAR22_19115 [Gammaproteobacteria bacterium]|nr:hypothetical protein [Gammaproteobacteria bacterium]
MDEIGISNSSRVLDHSSFDLSRNRSLSSRRGTDIDQSKQGIALEPETSIPTIKRQRLIP